MKVSLISDDVKQIEKDDRYDRNAQQPQYETAHGFISLVKGLFAPEGVFDAANGVADFAGGLVSLAFALELGVAGYLAGDFLDLAFGLLR
jgi:hypothetical protein